MSFLREFHQAFQAAADPQQAKNLARFFKTAKGQYGEGDLFLGLKVPQTRSLVAEYKDKLSLQEVETILDSPYHEIRLAGALLLVTFFEESQKIKDIVAMKKIYQLYLKNSKKINNWDLVDLSAAKIVGAYLIENSSALKDLENLCRSENLWQKRIAILSTWPFIKAGKLDFALKYLQKFLAEEHDLLHKAVGWMLRELGKADQEVLLNFLEKHYDELSRMTLRYAIERIEERQRQAILQGKF